MNLEVHADAHSSAARAAAGFIASDARAVVSERHRYVMAISGGRTPWLMLRALANENVPWNPIHIFQVDERVAPAGQQDRNLTHLQENSAATGSSASSPDACNAC